MPRLASLSLVFRRSPGWSDSESARARHGDQCQVDPPQLSALEVVRVAGAPFDIEGILHAVSSPVLHTAMLSVAIPDSDTDGWTRCATVLSTRFSRSLRTARVECTRSGLAVPSHARPFQKYVRPLLPLRLLQECTITIEDPAGVALTNEDVDTMASSWTSLSTLEVSLHGGASCLPRPTFSSLLSFVHRCPGLTTLRLPFSQQLDSLASDEDWSRVRSRADLHELWLSEVSFSRRDTDMVTQYLRHLFPKVDLVPLINAGVLRES
uniref:APH domain-containing protein n=1 Tax=Ganoderma boninense TaxID=34458 RepID=A0A5K1JZ37_9APHY|nr:APH domain-containing protein [Ganoderma boninense]